MENYAGMVADISAATRPNFIGYGGYGGAGGWEGLLGLAFVALLFGGFGGGGFGGNGGGWQQGFNTQTIVSKLDGITNGISDATYALNNGINGLSRDYLQCCCETNRNIDAVRAENYKNTCEIVNAIHKEGEETRGLITHNLMQEMRDKLADKDRDILARDFQLSQLAQNTYLINALNPQPVPSYIVRNPKCCNDPFMNWYQQ